MKKKAITISLGIFVLSLCIYTVLKSGTRVIDTWNHNFRTELSKVVQKSFSPGMYYAMNQDGMQEPSFLSRQILEMFPLGKYLEDKTVQTTQTEDELTYAMLLELQAKDEERFSEDLVNANQAGSQAVSGTVTPSDLSLEKLRDFNYLVSKLYTVDSTTTIGPDQLNVDQLLSKDMHINRSKKGPKVLIFHTHSQETFADSVPGDTNTSIVGMGAYLADKLNSMGIETIHHDGVYDLIDGKLDRSKAYEMSEKGVREILNQYPTIEVVIDLHRDGVRDDVHLVTDVNGKQAARIMFFNGLSRTKTNGDIEYLYNPYIQDNLSFSLQMQLAAESMYPDFTRRIYLKGYRYSLHMMPKSLLIEAGAQTNTVEEVRNSMDILANILNEVLVK